MNSIFLGCLYAVIASIFVSFYIIPKKLSKQKAIHYNFYMGLGFFIGSIFIFLINFSLTGKIETLTNRTLFFSILAGILWAAASTFLLISIDIIGLARSNQWKNIQGPIGVILSLIVLSEFRQTNALFAVLAGLMIFASALFLTIRHDNGKKVELKGIIFALLSAMFFGTTAIITKYITIQSGVYSQQVIFSFVIFLSISFYILVNKNLRNELFSSDKRDKVLGFIGGLLYLGASFFTLQSFRFVPASIAYTIIQLNALWVIAIGIFYFKEIDYRKNRWRIYGGLFYALLGIVLLFFTKK